MHIPPARVVKPSPVPEDIICVICTGVLLDPVDGPCQHPTCRECLDNWFSKSKSKTCPTCRQPLKPSRITPTHRFIKNRLDELEVTCDNAPRGCQAVVALGTLKNHVATCGWATVPCQHDGCTATMLRQELPNHLQACPQRIILCKRCNASIKHQDEQDHLGNECPAVNVACQHNGICGKRVRRDELATHIDTECSLATVPCIIPGCKRKMVRGALKEHLAESQAEHITSLALALHEANSKVVALEAELAKLQGGNSIQCIATLREHRGTITRLAAADGHLYSASHDGSIRVWSLRDYKPVHAFDKLHDVYWTEVTVGDGVIYGIGCTGAEDVFTAWRVSDYKHVPTPEVDCSINTAIPYKGKLYCAFHGKGIEILPPAGHPPAPMRATEDAGDSGLLVIDRDVLYTLDHDGLIQGWSMSTFEQQCEGKCEKSGTWLALTLGNGTVYSASGAKTIQVSHALDLSCRAVIHDENLSSNFNSLAAGGGFLFAGAKDGTIKVWSDNDYSKVMTVLAGHKSPVAALLVHEGMLFSGSEDGKIKVWRIPSL
eukprot:jgi/Mesvir1/12304/Mv00505-RA.1